MDTAGMPLPTARPGCDLRVCSLHGGNGCTQRLRELGLLEGRTIRLLANKDPIICQIGGCRFGLCQKLARCVIVEPISPGPAA